MSWVEEVRRIKDLNEEINLVVWKNWWMNRQKSEVDKWKEGKKRKPAKPFELVDGLQ